jgi:hypothetical protein
MAYRAGPGESVAIPISVPLQSRRAGLVVLVAIAATKDFAFPCLRLSVRTEHLTRTCEGFGRHRRFVALGLQRFSIWTVQHNT